MTSATTTPRIAWIDANAHRLRRQGLAEPLDTPIPDVVAAMCGAHAQVMSAAELAIGLRMTGITRGDVRRALWEKRTLVKTYGPRGTVHLLPARDLPLWLGALAAVPRRSPMTGDARLTDAQIESVVAAIGEALAGDDLTIDELDERVITATGTWAGDLVMPAFGGYWPRWRQAIGMAAHHGALCFGPNCGRKTTYSSPRRWMNGFEPVDADSALRWLVTSYLAAYGPATPAHFARWLAAPVGWAKTLFASIEGKIVRVDVDGEEGWIVAGDKMSPGVRPPDVRLLPYFDAFVVASQPRERLFPGHAASRALSGSQAGNFPVVLIDGVVAGVWHQRRSGRRIDITVEPLGDLTSRQRAGIDREADRVAAILDGRADVTIGEVSVGPHA